MFMNYWTLKSQITDADANLNNGDYDTPVLYKTATRWFLPAF